MKRIKRQQTDTIFDNNNNNKKSKLENEIIPIKINKSHFEDLANEILYEIFEYLNINDAYEGFFNLNKRFKNLFINCNLPIKVNISTVSKSNLERYHKNLILPNKHRINIFRLSNPFTVDIIFSPPRIISKFIQLEILILNNITAKYLYNILRHAIVLPKLYSLILNLVDLIQDLNQLFVSILRLSKLKSCKMTYEIKHGENPSLLFVDEYKLSPIEHMVINSHFPYNSLGDLLYRLPALRHLSMNSLARSAYLNIDPSRIALKDLKYVSLKVYGVDFHPLEILIKYFFRHVEVFRLTARFNEAYLDAKKWEQLIVSYMPNLHIFDINYHYHIDDNSQIEYHNLINQFNSSFWIERKWFFTHQHDWLSLVKMDNGIFYSTYPYRRKDYKLYWEFDKEICSQLQETNLTSVKHVHFWKKETTDSCINYFPNATELTIEKYFRTPDDSISITLNHIIPLKQITKLFINSYEFTFEQMVELIRFIPNLHTLKLNYSHIYETSPELIKQSDHFQYVSHTNKIQNLELPGQCWLKHILLYIDLFPQVEYLKTRMYRKEIEKIIRDLLSKNNNETRHLLFLCISQIPKICLREINTLIKREKLLVDYFIKFINGDLYLWW